MPGYWESAVINKPKVMSTHDIIRAIITIGISFFGFRAHREVSGMICMPKKQVETTGICRMKTTGLNVLSDPLPQLSKSAKLQEPMIYDKNNTRTRQPILLFTIQNTLPPNNKMNNTTE